MSLQSIYEKVDKKTAALAVAGAIASIAAVSYAVSNPNTQKLCKSKAHNDTVSLSDGRKIGYSSHGEGWPVFFFPPVPGSRLWFPPNIGDICKELNIRFIVIERPSCGLSSPISERSYRTFANDVSEFADKLKISKFSLIGHSGGAMHALATAAFLPDKVVKLAVIGAAAQPKSFKTPRSDFDSFAAFPKHMQDSVNLVGKSPHWLTRFAFWTVSSHLQNPSTFATEILAHPGESSAFGDDQNALSSFKSFIEENIIEFFRQGMKPMVDDMRSFCTKPWEFDPEDIKQETSIFVGKLDDYSPVSHSEYLAAKIYKATLNVMDGEGHYSIYWKHAKQIIESVIPK